MMTDKARGRRKDIRRSRFLFFRKGTKMSEWDRWEKAIEEGPWSTAKKMLWFVIPLTILVSVIGFTLNPFKQAARIVNKTIDADNAIYNYEYFHNLFEEVLATDVKIANMMGELAQFREDAGPRKEWTFEDKTEYSRLQSTITGLRNHRASCVANYNARSKMANRSIFLDSMLPQRLL